MKNPKERIYLVLYEKPLNVSEVNSLLYKKRNAKVSRWITELKRKSWLKEVKNYYLFKNGKKKDERYRYYQSTQKGILDSICKEIELTSIEKQKLTKYLKSKAFVNYVLSYVNSIEFKDENSGFSKLKNDLGVYALFRFCVCEYIKKRLGVDVTNKDIIELSLQKTDLPNEEMRKHIELVEFDKLGSTLIKKLSFLAKDREDIYFYFNHLTGVVERTIEVENRLQERASINTTNNGHGLS